jgi:hypothetical protein
MKISVEGMIAEENVPFVVYGVRFPQAAPNWDSLLVLRTIV